MKKIPSSHRFGHKSTLIVQNILADSGAISEVIKNDYGEDLLVQTQLDDVSDNFYILIQVKGLRSKPNNDEKRSFRFEVRDLQRWVSHSQSIMVCVYDRRDDILFAFKPQDHFTLWFLMTTRYEKVSVKLGKESIFDADSARDFIWDCRIEYFSKMIAWYDLSIDDSRRYDEFTNSYLKIEREKNLIVLSFANSLKIAENGIFSDNFKSMISIGSKNFSEKNKTLDSDEDKLDLMSVFTLAILGQAQDVCGRGLPTNLLDSCAYVVSALFRHIEPKIWGEVEELFK